MRLMSERLSMLQECDLTESQSRVYLALIEYPANTASSLAKAAQIPRNRLYEILEELNGLGLVDIILEEPRRYRGRPIDSFLTRCTSELRAKIERLEARRAYLTAAFEPREQLTPDDLERGTTQAVTGRRAVAQEIDRMIGEARREIVLAGSSGGALRLAKHLLEARPLPAGLNVELYAPASSAQNGGWENFLEGGIAEVRWIDVARATIVLVVDQEEMLRIHPLPDDDRTHVGQDFALLTNSLAIIHDELVGIRNLPRSAAPAKLQAEPAKKMRPA